MTEEMDHVTRIQAAWQVERPDLDVSPQGVIGRLHRLANHLTNELTTVYDKYGLSEGEFDVLAALRRSGTPYERAPGEIALHTMVTTGAVTKRLDRLEQAGLVIRRRSAADGRGRVVRLTAAGRRLIDRAFEAHMANEHRLLAALTPTETTQLESLLKTWLSQLEPAERSHLGRAQPRSGQGDRGSPQGGSRRPAARSRPPGPGRPLAHP